MRFLEFAGRRNSCDRNPRWAGKERRSRARHWRRRDTQLVELTGAADPPPRLRTGDAELDRVTGGGLVPGSALLIGGDPGIGKSTLLLQTAAKLARGSEGRKPVTVAYVSGEESVDQVRLRAERLEAADAPVQLAAGTAVRDILTTFDGPTTPDLLIIDSIQTMYLDTLESAPGTVAQVRGSAQELIGLAKRRGTALILVCLLYTSPSPRDRTRSRMPSSA